MKLLRLRVRNFRCYRDEVTFDFSNLTAFVGKNDAGKSTVMDALDLFLNDAAPDKNDASKGGNAKDVTLICEFGDLPTEIVIDDENPTTFAAEHLLNEAGHLEIHKTFNGSLATPKCSSISAYAVHPTAKGVSDLLKLKNKELKSRAEVLKIDMTGIDPKVNAQVRQGIRTSVGELWLKPCLVPMDEENTSRPWTQIKAYLPVFALFKSDRASTDQDPEAQDPLKAAVREAIKQREQELTAITSHVEAEVRRIADATLLKLREMDPNLAQQLNPQISVKKWDTLFNVSITGDQDIPINKRGSGVKRLVLLNFFRAKAQQLPKDRGKAVPVIYGIEEPETSQHPHNQRLLVNALLEISGDSQVIVTTHTPMLARTLSDDCLRYIHVKANGEREVRQGGDETRQLVAKSLGVLPDNDIKLFIGVEGAHDITFLKTISKILLRDGCKIFDLEQMELDGELIFFPLGGSSLALWTSRLAKLDRPEFHLFDRDVPLNETPQYQGTADAINQRKRCKAVLTGKKEMENYLHMGAINEAYQEVSNTTLNLQAHFAAFDDVPAFIAERVHTINTQTSWGTLDEKKRKEKISNAKRHLNSHASAKMTLARLEEIDPDGHVLEWFEQMKALVEN